MKNNYFEWQQSDYYTLLGVTQMSGNKEIHKAYREKAKLYHPDKYPLNSVERKTAGEKFKELTVAHDTLMDAQKRSAYDDQLAIIQSCYQAAVIFDFKPIPKEDPPEEEVKKKPKFSDHLKKAARMAEDDELFQKYQKDAVEINTKERKGTSEASKKSAAQVYFQQGMTYFKYKEYTRALSAFKNAQQLDPNLKVPQYIWSQLRWMGYKYY